MSKNNLDAVKKILNDFKHSQLKFKHKMEEHRQKMSELQQKRNALSAKPKDKSLESLRKISVPSGPILSSKAVSQREIMEAENKRTADLLASVIVPKGEIGKPSNFTPPSTPKKPGGGYRGR